MERDKNLVVDAVQYKVQQLRKIESFEGGMSMVVSNRQRYEDPLNLRRKETLNDIQEESDRVFKELRKGMTDMSYLLNTWPKNQVRKDW